VRDLLAAEGLSIGVKVGLGLRLVRGEGMGCGRVVVRRRGIEMSLRDALLRRYAGK
jgi:hypothetical protein